MKFALVAAVDKNNGLGKDNKLVWRLPADVKYFTDITSGKKSVMDSGFQPDLSQKMNAVIMGRKTWESIPLKHRPLKDRLNIVLTREKKPITDFATSKPVVSGDLVWAGSLEEALKICQERGDMHDVFVIGGAMLYAEAINHPDCQTIYLTRIHHVFDCDAFFPEIDEKIFEIKERSELLKESDLEFEFLTYERKK